jgi:hypothetical protein
MPTGRGGQDCDGARQGPYWDTTHQVERAAQGRGRRVITKAPKASLKLGQAPTVGGTIILTVLKRSLALWVQDAVGR